MKRTVWQNLLESYLEGADGLFGKQLTKPKNKGMSKEGIKEFTSLDGRKDALMA